MQERARLGPHVVKLQLASRVVNRRETKLVARRLASLKLRALKSSALRELAGTFDLVVVALIDDGAEQDGDDGDVLGEDARDARQRVLDL